MEGNTPNFTDPTGEIALAPIGVLCAFNPLACVAIGIGIGVIAVGVLVAADALAKLANQAWCPAPTLDDEDRTTVEDDTLPESFRNFRYRLNPDEGFGVPYVPPDPNPQPTRKVCDPNAVRRWMQLNPGIVEVRGGDEFDFQRHYCGLKYSVSGGGETVQADGIRLEDCRLLDAKYIGDAAESPFVFGSKARARGERFKFIDSIDQQESNLFRRYSAVINAPESENPFVGLDVITNEPKSFSYWQHWIDIHNVPNTFLDEKSWPI